MNPAKVMHSSLDVTRLWECLALFSPKHREFWWVFQKYFPFHCRGAYGRLWQIPQILDHLDSSFGALGKQRRHRTASCNRASCSWAFFISPVSSSPPQYNNWLSAKTGVCLRKWSLDVCLIWTNSVTEHAAQRAWVTLTKQLPPPYHSLQKDWKESSIRGLSLKRCSVPMPGFPISPHSLFH